MSNIRKEEDPFQKRLDENTEMMRKKRKDLTQQKRMEKNDLIIAVVNGIKQHIEDLGGFNSIHQYIGNLYYEDLPFKLRPLYESKAVGDEYGELNTLLRSLELTDFIKFNNWLKNNYGRAFKIKEEIMKKYYQLTQPKEPEIKKIKETKEENPQVELTQPKEPEIKEIKEIKQVNIPENPQIKLSQPKQNTFSSNEMSDYFTYAKNKAKTGNMSAEKAAMKPQMDDIVKKMSPEEKDRYLSHLLLSHDYRVVGDKDAKYKTNVDRLTVVPQNVINAFDLPKNQWAKLIRDKPMDLKYNLEMLDPDYAAWYAAKNGKVAYYKDINGDGTEDVIVTNPSGTKIEWYNGYKPTKSNQRIALKYHQATDPQGHTKSGGPLYTNRPSLSEWYNEHSRKLDEEGTIAEYNAKIGTGLKKWVARDMTVNELWKEIMTKDEFKKKLNQSGYTQQQQVIIGKVCPVNRFRSLISTAVMSVLGAKAGIQGTIKDIVTELNKYLNKKVPKGITNPFLPVKQAIVEFCMKVSESYNKVIIGMFLNGSTFEEVLTTLIQTINTSQVLQQQEQLSNSIKLIVDNAVDVKAIKEKNGIKRQIGGKRIQPVKIVNREIPQNADFMEIDDDI